MERFCHRAVPIQEVEDFVEQKQHWSFRRPEDAGDRVGAGCRRLRCTTESFDALVARELACNIDPWILASKLWVPGVPYEDRNSRCWHRIESAFTQQRVHAAEGR